jgi:hypothetical protein
MGTTRLLRAAKNRYGSTDEVGVLEMRSDGLVEVADASRFFLESEQPPVAGSAITIALEGTRRWPSRSRRCALRPVWVATTRDDRDRREPRADADRGARPPCRAEPDGHDVYVNVAGGLRIDEPAADLAVAVALASRCASARARGNRLAGELALSGRLRAAVRAERRLLEASRLGFERSDHRPARGIGRLRRLRPRRGARYRRGAAAFPRRIRGTGTTPYEALDRLGACVATVPARRGRHVHFSHPAGSKFIHGIIGSHDSSHHSAAGALLGTLFGFALGLALLRLDRRPHRARNGPAFLTAFVVAHVPVRLPRDPVRDDLPGTPRGREADRGRVPGEFALGGRAVLVGLVMGLLIGVPLAQLGGAAGSLLPPIVASSSRR